MKDKTDIVSKNNLPKALFIVLLLFSIHLWDLRYIPQKYNVEDILTWLVCGFCFFLVSKENGLHFKNAIILFFFGLLCNSVAAHINLGQNPYKTLLSLGFYFFIFIYFLLHYLKFKNDYMENIILIFATIYSLIYIVQAIVYPFPIIRRGMELDKGEFQFAIIGHGFLVLAYFLCLNRYLLNRRFRNLLMAVGFFVVLLMCNYRTLIGGAILLTVIMVLKIVRFNAKDFGILVLVSIVFVGLFQFKGSSHILEESVSQTRANINEGKKYVRLIQMEFFFKRYPANISYFIIGGGKPAGANLYRFNPDAMGQNYNFVWVDIGLFGFYIVIGGITLLGLLWYTIKAIFVKLPQDKLYLNVYFLYLLIVSFTNEEIYREGIFTVQAIGLYLIDLAINEKAKSEDAIKAYETPFSNKR